MEVWTRGKFHTVFAGRVTEVDGFVKRGLGLYRNAEGRWWPVHMNSGHGVCKLAGEVIQVMAVASEIAEATDWDFDEITGWKNRDPDLPKKIGAVWARNPLVMPDDIPGENMRDERAARLLLMTRLQAEGEA